MSSANPKVKPTDTDKIPLAEVVAGIADTTNKAEPTAPVIVDESTLIFSGIQALNRARKKLSPVGQQRLLKACNELFGV